MAIFDYDDSEALGKIIAVDTAVVVVRVDQLERLKRVQVNRLVALQSSKAGQHLVGVVSRITRKALEATPDVSEVEIDEVTDLPENNLVRVSLIGTLIDKQGLLENIFRRTLETVPEIDANCFALEGDRLTDFMQVISNVTGEGPQLELGKYTLDENATAFLNGNRLFQRHAVVVGSTGSGKSYTTARILDQVAVLDQANAILFDIHGEYKTLDGEEFRHLRVAGPGDLDQDQGLDDGVLYLPYWLLGYEAMVSLFVDRSDQNAPNQAMVMANTITDAKRQYLTDGNHEDVLANFTVDSPVPFPLDQVHERLAYLDTERVPGAKANTDKAGDFNGKLSRLIARFEAKHLDRRLGFIFQPHAECMEMHCLPRLAHALTASRGTQKDNKGGIKIIDFSEVPSDILPLMVSLLARLVFNITQWTPVEKRHPIALFCDEAHLYIPERAGHGGVDDISVGIFERIAKEGRKYGVGLVVISQRPSEVNRTVLSQCNNVVAMRLTNGDDQSVIRRLLPDSLGGFGDLLPVLDVGEALVVGDASLLPTRVRIGEPRYKPNSATIDFLDYAPCSAAFRVEQRMNKLRIKEVWAMARNKVQFQKGLSEPEFERLYGTEEQCRAAVVASRWPQGFVCPVCDGTRHSVVKTRGLYQCSACRTQTSPIAGTIFAATKLKLRVWFRALYHLTQTKQGISSIELGRRLGVTQTTAWKIKHKLGQVMLERDGAKQLCGRIEIDDAYIGGARTGGKRGRGASGKTPFVAAVETTPEGKPVRLKLRRVTGFRSASIAAFARQSLDPECAVISDGLACFAAVTHAGCSHAIVKTGSGPKAAKTPTFKWVNTALGNIKAAITGTHRSVSAKHVPRYLAEFEYRFNRRYDLAAMIPRLTWASVRTPPMPYRLLKLAEVHA